MVLKSRHIVIVISLAGFLTAPAGASDREDVQDGAAVVESLERITSHQAPCGETAATNPETSVISNSIHGIRPGDSAADLAALGAPQLQVDGVKLGRLEDLQLRNYEMPLKTGGAHRFSAYLKEDRYIFGLFVPGETDEPFPRSPGKWKERMGAPPQDLKSFYTQTARLWLYPASGLGVHVDNGRVLSVELFEPTQVQDYKKRFHTLPARR